MRSIKPLLALTLILCAFVFFPLFIPALAQGPDVFDFTTSDHGFVAITDMEGAAPPTTGFQCATAYVASTGFRADGTSTCGDDGVSLVTAISKDFGTPTYVYQVIVEGYANLESTPYDPPVVSASLRDLDDRQNILVSASGGTLSGPFSITLTLNSAVEGFYITTGMVYSAGCCFDYSAASEAFITEVTVSYYTPTPTPTNTPTSTPLFPVPTPTGNPAVLNRTCALLGTANANGRSGHTWSLTDNVLVPPADRAAGFYYPSTGGTGTLKLRLNQAAQYRIEGVYLNKSPTLAGQFSIKLGQNPQYLVTVNPTSANTSFNVGASNYTPGTDGFYDLVVNYPSTGGTPNFVITFICVVQVTPASNTPTDDGASSQCQQCVYSPVTYEPENSILSVVENIKKLIATLTTNLGKIKDVVVCVMRNIWECILVALLKGLWNFVAGLLGYFIQFFQWLWLVVGMMAIWAWDGLVKAIGWLNIQISNLGTWIVNGLNQLIDSASNSWIILALQWLVGFLTFSINLLSQILAFVQRVINTIYILITATIAGVNQPANVSVIIADSSVLYWLSLGFYVLDNTIFEGPVWYLVPISIAFISWTVIIWAKEQLKRLFSL